MEAEPQREVERRRDERRRTSGGGRGAVLEGIPIGISHARRGRGTWAAWWAGPAHFLLLSFSFFLFFFSSSSTTLSCCFKFFLNS